MPMKVALGVRGGEPEQVVAVAEADLDGACSAAAEQRPGIHSERGELDTKTRPQLIQGALLGGRDAPGARDEGADGARVLGLRHGPMLPGRVCCGGGDPNAAPAAGLQVPYPRSAPAARGSAISARMLKRPKGGKVNRMSKFLAAGLIALSGYLGVALADDAPVHGDDHSSPAAAQLSALCRIDIKGDKKEQWMRLPKAESSVTQHHFRRRQGLRLHRHRRHHDRAR